MTSQQVCKQEARFETEDCKYCKRVASAASPTRVFEDCFWLTICVALIQLPIHAVATAPPIISNNCSLGAACCDAVVAFISVLHLLGVLRVVLRLLASLLAGLASFFSSFHHGMCAHAAQHRFSLYPVVTLC